MSFIAGIFSHTPIWVFALFAVLIWRGIWMMRDRVMPRPRLFITPVAFTVLGVTGLILQPYHSWSMVAAWVIGLVLVVPVGLILVPRNLRRAQDGKNVFMPGSVWPLVRFMVIFWSQYGMSIASAAAPPGASATHLLAALVSGATAGFFSGTMIESVRRTRARPASPHYGARSINLEPNGSV